MLPNKEILTAPESAVEELPESCQMESTQTKAGGAVPLQMPFSTKKQGDEEDKKKRTKEGKGKGKGGEKRKEEEEEEEGEKDHNT